MIPPKAMPQRRDPLGSGASKGQQKENFMKSYHVDSGAGIAGINVKKHDQPAPGPREVLIRVRATSLNFRELMILRGNYPLPIKPDVVLASDGAGEIAAVGEGVTRAKVGDRVAAAIFPLWLDGPFRWEVSAQIGGSLDGMLTEYAVLAEEAVVHVPDHLSFEEAATLPCAAVTAWNAVTSGQVIQPGQSVLILGSGGVSLFALQFAKSCGARVIATTSSDHKAQRLTELGADDTVNYCTTPDWHVVVRELTGGRGVDRVIEVGGAGTLERSFKSVAVAGQISWVGGLAAGEPTISLSVVRSAVATLQPISVGSRAQFIAMNRAIAVNRLKPVIDRRFSFDEAIDAFRYYEAGQNFGKVVINHG
jgi:NADPH:quinone reductase-like Zn-dependent oxidoreductase